MNDRPHDHSDDRDDELRALLDEAVSDIAPRPALDRIQARTKVTPMSSKRPWYLAAAGAVAATAATVVAVTVISDDDPSRTAGEPTSSATPTPTGSATPSETPSQTPSTTPSEPATEEKTLPVYYVGDTNAGPRLFREFHELQVEDAQTAAVRVAVAEALDDTAIDPDYGSPWPDGTTAGQVRMDGDVLTIDLAGAPRDRPSGMAEGEAQVAVQQLVHTAHAVLQKRPPVQLLIDGQRSDMVLGVPTSEPLAVADAIDVQASVWIITPQDGDVVGRSVKVEGRGAFFEANVSWQLLENGRVVDEGFATAEEGMTLSPYSFTLKAEPGDYVLRVYEADMSGGEGNGEAEDTKRITVR